MRASVMIIGICCAVLVGAGRAQAEVVPPINYGVADDAGKYADDGGAWVDSMLKGANLTEERWTLQFDADQPDAIDEMPFLLRAAPQAQKDGIHVVLALYARPAVNHDAAAFCAWAGMVASTVQQWGINDFIVWNEPNTSLYWSPQDASAPVAYEALLAQCYDSIHAADANARVIGFGLSPRSNGSGQTAPIPFILGVGDAYRASGRTTPIMDQMSVHPYPNPNHPIDGPDVGYNNVFDYGVPNLDRVKQAVYDAFNGTGQPTTLNGLTFRIDELGWQTDTTAYTQYYDRENVSVVSEQTQAQYVQEAVQNYFACDPTVTDVEWFLLVDEPTRDGKEHNGKSIGGGWQSGFLTAGGEGVSTEKVSYTADAPFFAQGRAACTSGMVNWKPSAGGTSNSAVTGDISRFLASADAHSLTLALGATSPALAQGTSLKAVLTGAQGSLASLISAARLKQPTIVSASLRVCAQCRAQSLLAATPPGFRTVAQASGLVLRSTVRNGAKAPAGRYFLVVVLQSRANPRQRFALAIQTAVVAKKSP